MAAVISSALLGISLLASPPVRPAPRPLATAALAASPTSRDDFRAAMRKLWEDHVTWTRLFIVSATGGLPDLQATANRLLQNQADIGNAIKPFYGDAAGTALTGLLRSHILIASDLVTAAKAGNAAAMDSASARWNANADSIADFLAAANPRNWPRETLRANMHHHLELTLREASARLHNDWAGDVAAYDAIHEHILQLADVLSSGIIAQFPRQFASR